MRGGWELFGALGFVLMIIGLAGYALWFFSNHIA